jgi:FAD/FMN-containing dehydrogenase
LLQGAAGVGIAGVSFATGWAVHGRIPAGSQQSTIGAPPEFPGSIDLYQQTYRNWSGEISVDHVWTTSPRTPHEVVDIVNWAHRHGWRIRPRGMSHGWSPFVIPAGHSGAGYLVVDTTTHLTALQVEAGGSPATVTAQTGVAMDTLLSQLSARGLGLTANPAPGDLTLGGVLAIGGHGTAIRADGEIPVPGSTYGSVSNRVLSLTAVVWNAAQGAYTLRTFHRDDPGIGPLLVHMGRSFVTEATLQVGREVALRCQSILTIPQETLFAPPSRAGSQSFQSLVLSSGRVEAIQFPFTEFPWVKVWTVEPTRPATSRSVSEPYNYPFANTISDAESSSINQRLTKDPAVTQGFMNSEFSTVVSSLGAEGSADIWGPAHCSTLYVKPTTLKVTANGYAVLCATHSIQRVVNDFTTRYAQMVAAQASHGRYPIQGPIEFRVTGLDHPGDIDSHRPQPALLSALRPRPDHPEWNCAVWIDALSIPGAPQAARFYQGLETWMLNHYSGSYASVRFEWSKGWAYSETGAWSNGPLLRSTVPEMYTAGQPSGGRWAEAVAALDAYDPHRVLTAPLHDVLMPPPTR